MINFHFSLLSNNLKSIILLYAVHYDYNKRATVQFPSAREEKKLYFSANHTKLREEVKKI